MTATIESLFADWRTRADALNEQVGICNISDDDLTAACGDINGLADAALALPPLTVADVYRKIVLVLDAPEPDDSTHEAQLAREARAALGLPINRI